MTTTITEKYAAERLKRLRPDAAEQYSDARNFDLRDLATDPWADYASLAAQPQPLRDGDSIKFLVVGGGHAGVISAARIVEAGFSPDEVVVVDVAGGFGGTWYWNRYPGLMCDVEGYCYLPMLEETRYMPRHKYSYGAEIRGQSERIAATYGFKGLFCTKVENQIWREDKGKWEVTMTQSLGDVRGPTKMTVNLQFLIVTGGVLSLPKLPSAPGFAKFRAQKQVFHTARWDYGITGGSQEVPDLDKLRDKRIAIIGTGATAVQAVSHLAKWSKHLYVIQRTPSYCGARGQKETTAEDWAEIVSSGKGWQRRRVDNLNSYLTANPEPVDLVNDGWTQNLARAGLIGGAGWSVTAETFPQHLEKLLELDMPIAEKLRARINKIVKDPAVAEKLKPWYPGWCKRPTFNDDYLESFNRDNVTLVDTDGKGIREFTDRGLIMAGGDHEGVEIDVDVLVLATGFTTGSGQDPAQRIEAPIIGPAGRSLSDYWQGNEGQDDFSTLFGLASPGFPNLFFFHLAGSGTSYNLTSSYDASARLLAHVLNVASKQSSAPDNLVIEPSRAASLAFTDRVVETGAWFGAVQTCTPSYFNREGAKMAPGAQERRRRQTCWGKGLLDWQRVMDEYKARTMSGLEGWETRTVEATA